MNDILGTKAYPDGSVAYLVRADCRGCCKYPPGEREFETPRGTSREQAKKMLFIFTCDDCVKEADREP